MKNIKLPQITSLLLVCVTLTLSVNVGSVHVNNVPFLPTMSLGQLFTLGASPSEKTQTGSSFLLPPFSNSTTNFMFPLLIPRV